MEFKLELLFCFLPVSLQSLLHNLLLITLIFSVSCALFYVLRSNFYCNCHICTNYVLSKWCKDFKNLSDWYTHLLQESPSQTIHNHVLNNIITSNPENVEHILRTNFRNYPKGKTFSILLGDLLGKGIFNVDGDLWQFQRRMASLALSTNSIQTYAFELVTNEIKSRLIPVLSSAAKNSSTGGGVIDLQDVFIRFSFDNICKLSFGLDPGCLESSLPISLFASNFDLASELIAKRALATFPLVWKIKRFFRIGSEKALKEGIRVVNHFAYEVISQKRKLDFVTDKDLLSTLMSCVTHDDEYLRDIVVSFILAGRDTMASALSTLFLLLAKHPEVVSKIREELSNQPTGLNQESVSYEQVRGMHYLQAAVYESMRLYPPVQFDSKFASNDDTLPDGTFVRKGTRVTFHPYAMGRMEKIWGPDYMEFKPERWIKDCVFCSAKSPFQYPVFQAGPRVCLGKELSIVEMKVVTVYVLHKFDIEVVANGTPKFTSGLTAKISSGVQAVIKERAVQNVGSG